MTTPFAGVQAPNVYRHRVGAFEITVLSDGNLALEASLFSGDQARAEKLLEAAFLPKVGIPTAVNEWLINIGEKLILVDTVASNVFAPTLGRLPWWPKLGRPAMVKARSAARAGRRCARCNKPLTTERATGKFCSVRCRVAAHRERRRRIALEKR